MSTLSTTQSDARPFEMGGGTSVTPAMLAGFIRGFLAELRQTQFLPPADLILRQRRFLEPVVRHARTHVPFYRDSGRLDVLFGADGAIDWDRWSEIAPLSRGDVQRAGDALRSEMFQGNSHPYSTSGATGEPLTVWHAELSDRIVRTAVILRDCEHYGIDPTKRLLFFGVSPPTGIESKGIRRQDVWYAGFATLDLRGERFDCIDSLAPRELIDIASDIKPDYLGAHPVALELMVAHDSEQRLRKLGFEAAMATGGGFSDGAKPSVEQALGCPIMQVYGSNECLRMARSCPECGRYHVHSDVVHLEVIDDEGAEAAVGETGWVIATPLYSYAMPLIRYHHADRAIRGAPGGCDVMLPALDAVLGKEQPPFVFPGGLAIRPKVPIKAVIDYLGAQSFEIAQVAPDRCELRFVRGRLSPAELRFDEMTALLRSIWWPGLLMDYRMVDALPRPTPGAKIANFVRSGGSFSSAGARLA